MGQGAGRLKCSRRRQEGTFFMLFSDNLLWKTRDFLFADLRADGVTCR
jgi:hypothetical protein